MSIHGICFDEGTTGNCGIKCRGFPEECPIKEEMFENIDDLELLEYGKGDDYLIEKYVGSFKLAIFEAQTQIKFDLWSYIEKEIKQQSR